MAINEARAALLGPGAVTEVTIDEAAESQQVTVVVTLGSEALSHLLFEELRSSARSAGGLRLGPVLLGARFVEADEAPPA